MANDDDTLVDRVREYLRAERVHLLHRLDRQTSGVVLFAKTSEIARALREQFENGRVEKTYLAMVRGIAPKEGLIDHPIPRSENGERIDARTTFRLLACKTIEPRSVSLVECKPITGRFHQLRRHLNHIDHPILMDSNYGPTKLNRQFRDEWGTSRLTLHAKEITFDHPMTNDRLTVAAPIPDDLAALWKRIGLT